MSLNHCRALALAAAICLMGCAARLEVSPIEKTDPAQFARDAAICTPAAQAYTVPVTVGSVLFGALTAAINTAAYVFLDWRMPVLGAAGGASNAALAGYDLTGQARTNVYRHCMQDKVARDHSAIIANPDAN